MATQKAYRLHAYGDRSNIRLDDVPIPTPGAGQVLVAVSAVFMNPFDWKIREGYVRDELKLDLPATMGVDFVGSVVALGDGATRFAVGDRVMTMSRSLGAYAEHIAVDAAILAHVPAALSDVDAATLPIPGLPGGPLRAGMTVLVHGASGTTGSFAVQFAKQAGATVIGTASAKNRDHVLSLGADQFIDYQTERFEDRVHDVDLVLDFVLVGGAMSTTDRSWSVLRPGGAPGSAIVTVADPAILGKIPAGYRGFFPEIHPDVAQLEMLADQLATGKLEAKVARVFRRGELLDAMDLNQSGGTVGRLIVDFKQP